MPQPLERDLDVTRRTLLDWFAGVIPDGSDFRIGDLRGPSGTGFSSDTLIFDLEHRCDGSPKHDALVARIEPAGAFPVFPSYDVGLQFHTMRVMGEKGVPVPAMRWLEEDVSVLGSRFYVMERVEGSVPTDTPPYHQAGWVFELDPADRGKLWWSGLDAMAQVHCLDPADPAFAFLPRPGAQETPLDSPLDSQLDYYEGFLDWGCDRSRLPLIDQSLSWLRANAPQDESQGICWGDSRLANQIFRDQVCVAVIDWEMVFVGNPVADLAWWITLDRCFTEGIGVPRAEGFPSAAESVARWEDLVGRKAEHLGYYEIFAAFRFSIIMARIVGQMKYYEVLPDDHPMDVDNLGSAVLRRLLEEVGAS
jgi:aminoglycoside phosphotransferase (APT) family kinase protein